MENITALDDNVNTYQMGPAVPTMMHSCNVGTDIMDFSTVLQHIQHSWK